jgi:uncharacterized protein YkvS
MKELLRKIKSLPTATTAEGQGVQELQLLVDALVEKSNELGLNVDITFMTKWK